MSNQQTPFNPATRFALRRLHRDWKELEQEKASLPNIAALPTSDIFVWHCNLRPDCGPFAGVIFHLVLRFPKDYPHSPPDVELCSYLSHPNVFKWREQGYSLCLDMIQPYYTSVPYVGWTSAYSLLSILLQLQSFLFAENIPQNEYGSDPAGSYTIKAYRGRKSLEKSIAAARNFWYEVESYDGTLVKHTHSHPWPPLSPYKGKHPSLALTHPSGKIGVTTRKHAPPVRRLQFQYMENDFPALTNSPALTKSQRRNQLRSQQRARRRAAAGVVENHPPIKEERIIEVPTVDVQKTPVQPKPLLNPNSASVLKAAPSLVAQLPPETYTCIFSFLDPKGLLSIRNVCPQWQHVVVAYNLFERSQIQCFHSKVNLDDSKTILGVGLKVDVYPDGKSLRSATSPLDLLSQEAFDEEGVRTGVWGGGQESFDHFLPLILNTAHASKGIDRIEQTIYNVMKQCIIPSFEDEQKTHRNSRRRPQATLINPPHNKFHPLMAFHLLATLMNSMVVELMDSADHSTQQRSTETIQRHASEKALEGYCAFHHMLLYLAKKYPILIEFADRQVGRFLASEYFRHKRQTPNLGILLICLTLSRRGWAPLRRPLVMEAFDRNVRWVLQKHPRLSSGVGPGERLELTFSGAKTSLRLLMFKMQPTVADSSTYKMTARVLVGDEDLRCKIMWVRDVQTVVTGLNITTLDPCLAVVKTLMSPTSHSSFIVAIDQLATVRHNAALETAAQTDATNNNTAASDAVRAGGIQRHRAVNDVEGAIFVMLMETLPFKTLQKVKRHLRRNCRKPAGMKLRTYSNHLLRINVEELPNIPPRSPNNSLSWDELIDILLFGTPKSWQREMDRQGFDPLANAFHQVVSFMERIEESEDPPNDSSNNNKKNNSNSNKKDSNKRKPSNNSEKKSDDSSGNKKYCSAHGEGNHTSDECYTLKKQAKKLKEDGASSDKDKKKSDKEQMAADIRSVVRDGLRSYPGEISSSVFRTCCGYS